MGTGKPDAPRAALRRAVAVGTKRARTLGVRRAALFITPEAAQGAILNGDGDQVMEGEAAALDVLVHRHLRRAELLGVERRDLLVDRADARALLVVEHRAGEGAGDVVLGVLGGRARIEDRVANIDEDLIRQEAIRNGMLTLRASGRERIKSGTTTIEEVVRETVLEEETV